MAGIGPFDSFAFPGVYTRTLSEAPRATAAGALRFPVFIGVADEIIPVNNFEMIRGSSSIADNLIVKEDVSSQLTGLNRNFVVTYFPIVKGDGNGTTSNDPSSITVTVDGENAVVASVVGATGTVYLVNIPPTGSTVLVTYNYKRLDTLHVDEDVTVQVNGTRKTFKVGYVPIVQGNNGGIISTDPTTVTAKVNGLPVTVSSVNGTDGLITLAVAPTVGQTLTLTYYSNEYQDTADILPSPSVDSVSRIGMSPGTQDFVNGVDYVLDTTGNFNTINWGHSYKISSGTHTIATTLFDASQVSATLYDNLVFRRPVTDGTVDGTNRIFSMPFVPVSGEGLGIATDDPSKITVAVGANAKDAVDATVVSLDSATFSFILSSAPSIGSQVFVTEYQNRLTDDIWTLEDMTSGVTGVGTYSVTGEDLGSALDVTWDSADTTIAGFLKTDIVYPAGTGEGSRDTQVNPGSVSETVRLIFNDSTSYQVVSDNPSGTGSAGDNTGWLNQTYIDIRTGFRVTLLDPAPSLYATDDTVAYSVGTEFVTSVVPTRAVPGVRMTVTNTTGIGVGDTAIVTTYNKSGNEPNIGDFYYVSFLENKIDFDPGFYTLERDVFRDYGALNVNNKLCLAAHLAFLNGAPGVAMKQILKTVGGFDAPDSAYIAAIDEFNEPMEGGARPSVLIPVTTSQPVINYAKSSNAIQAGIRYGNERITYFGFALSTSPSSAQVYARAMNNERMIAVYPDGGIVALADERGVDVEYLVGGEFLAAAIAGRDTSPAFDVAEPMDRKPVVGFRRLFRRLDSVTAAQTANSGITLLEETAAGIDIRIALTTSLESALTRTPSVIKIKDFVQKGTRSVLEPFIGMKNLPQRTSEIQTTLNSFFKALRDAQIITAFTGIKATQNANDPSTIDVEAYYSPVVPLLWIVVTYNLRSRI